jgi:hypothetical protein
MAEAEKTKNGSKWLIVGLPLISAFFAVIGTVYVVGQRTANVTEVVKWKAEIAPRIERMDRQGSISFENFRAQYEKEQAKQYEQLEELSKARYSMEQKLTHLGDAEKAITGFDARLKRMEDEFSHFDVLEVEHRRLTKDFEQLKEEQRKKP